MEKYICKCCNREFKNEASLRGHIWYLQKIGGKLQERAWIKKVCPICSKEFETRKCHNHTHCSIKCSRQSINWRKNHSLKMIGKKWTEETKTKMSEAKKGMEWTEEHRKNWGDVIRGKKQPKETCLLKSKVMKGKPSPNKGNILSKETKLKMSKSHQGEKSHFWKGGITSLKRRIYSLQEYKIWRTSCFIRDKHTCQDCNKIQNKEVKIEVHHIKFFNILLKEFLQQYSQFSLIEDKEILVRLATTYQPFWDLSNGKTVCKICHKNYKKSYINHLKKEN